VIEDIPAEGDRVVPVVHLLPAGGAEAGPGGIGTVRDEPHHVDAVTGLTAPPR